MKFLDRFPALQSRDFRLLWIGQLISMSGSQMQIVALNWHIYLLTHSALALGLIGMVRFIPIVIFSLIGGTVADALNRKKLMMINQTCQGIFALILALQTFTHTISPLSIYILTALAAVSISFDTPARQAMIANLVKREHLPNAMSLNSIMFQTGSIIGPALAGFVIASFGIGNVYVWNALSFIAGIGALILMHSTGNIKSESAIPISLASIHEGIKFVKSKTLIWSTMILDFFCTFFAGANTLMPIFAKDILPVGPQGLGLLYSGISIGSVIAALVLTHLGTLKNQGKILLSAVFFYGLFTIIFGLSKNFWLSFLALMVVGAGDGVSTVLRNTMRQMVTPNHIRGRMTSINMIFFMGGPQLGEFEAGSMAALVGAPLSVVIGGIGTLLVVGFTTLKIPHLRNYSNHENLSPK